MVTTIEPRRAPPGFIGLRACGMLMLLCAAPARGTEWYASPSLRLRERYSDNINLALPADARSGLVLEAAPGFLLSTDGPRLTVDLAYALQLVERSREADTVSHQLAASVDAELLEDWLFLDARASISQRNVSAFGQQQVDDLARSDNQTRVASATVSPALRHRWPGRASASFRHSRDIVDSGDDQLAARSDVTAFDMTGDRAPGEWNWSLHADQRRSGRGSTDRVRASRATVSLNHPLASTVGLFATFGYENQAYQPLGAVPRGTYWSLGAGWTPSTRTSVSASAGRRYFGSTYSLEARYRTRRASCALTYGEDITSTAQQFTRLTPAASAELLDQLWASSMPDTLLRQQRVAAFVRQAQSLGSDAGAVNTFSQRYFLQKQWRFSMAAASRTSTFAAAINSTARVTQSSDGINSPLLSPLETMLEDRTRQRGGSAGWNWRMAARTSFNLEASHASAVSLSNGRRDSNLAVGAGLSRSLTARVGATVDLRRVRHSSNRAGGYRENSLGASLYFQL